MQFTKLALPDVIKVDLEPISDDRGFFARLFCRREFQEHGIETQIVQCNNTMTRNKGTIRGLHFQRPPKVETKFVRCVRGAVFDVAVDLRKESASFGQHVGLELSAGNRTMVVIPPGFAHGFQTLTNDVELIYFHTEFYSPDCEGGVNALDEATSINWPLEVSEMSDRDRLLPDFANVEPIEA